MIPDKTTIKLANGRVVDVGVKEKDELLDSIEQQNPKKIVISTVKALISSDDMMTILVDGTFNILNQLKYDIDIKKYDDLIRCDICNEIAECSNEDNILQFSCKKRGWWINR
jgi:hypothetical protein